MNSPTKSPTRTTRTEDQYWEKFKTLSASCYRFKNNLPELKIQRSTPTFELLIDQGRNQSNIKSNSIYQPQKELLHQELTTDDYIEYLKNKAPEIKKKTFAVYLASIGYGIQRTKGKNESERFIDALKNTKSQCEPNTKKTNTSSLKKKKLTDLEVNQLKDLAESSTKLIDKRLAIFVLASMHCGLRPSEWANTIFENGTLFVLNGKNSNGRSTGDIRSVPVSNSQWITFLDSTGVTVTESLLSILEETQDDRMFFSQSAIDQASFITGSECMFPINGQSEQRKEKVAEFFGSSSSKRFSDWDHPPSPYTGRHMFSANWKNVLTKEALALLLGHASEETAGHHYARRVQGLSFFRKHFTSTKSADIDTPNNNQDTSNSGE